MQNMYFLGGDQGDGHGGGGGEGASVFLASQDAVELMFCKT